MIRGSYNLIPPITSASLIACRTVWGKTKGKLVKCAKWKFLQITVVL